MKKYYAVYGVGNYEDLVLPSYIKKKLEKSTLPKSLALGDVIMGLDNSHSDKVTNFHDLQNSEYDYVLSNETFYYKKPNSDLIVRLELQEVNVDDNYNIHELDKILIPLGGNFVTLALSRGSMGFAVPDFLKSKVNSSDAPVRVALAREISNLETNMYGFNTEFRGKLLDGEMDYYKDAFSNFYSVATIDGKKEIVKLVLDTVCLSGKWRIVADGGVEYTEVIPEYKLVNDICNRCE